MNHSTKIMPHYHVPSKVSKYQQVLELCTALSDVDLLMHMGDVGGGSEDGECVCGGGGGDFNVVHQIYISNS